MGILAGAQNADKLAVTNKLAASVAFTAALDTSDEMIVGPDQHDLPKPVQPRC